MHHARSSTRYAKALLDLAIETGRADAVKADMLSLLSLLRESRDLRSMMSSPVIKADRKEAVLRTVFGNHFNPLTLDFLGLMAKNRREMYAEEIATDYVEGWRAHKGISKVTVTTATPLEPAQREALLRKAAELASGTIELEEKLQPELIGGFVLRSGDRQIDQSIATRLDRLRNEFDDNLYIKDF